MWHAAIKNFLDRLITWFDPLPTNFQVPNATPDAPNDEAEDRRRDKRRGYSRPACFCRFDNASNKNHKGLHTFYDDPDPEQADFFLSNRMRNHLQ